MPIGGVPLALSLYLSLTLRFCNLSKAFKDGNVDWWYGPGLSVYLSPTLDLPPESYQGPYAPPLLSLSLFVSSTVPALPSSRCRGVVKHVRSFMLCAI